MTNPKETRAAQDGKPQTYYIPSGIVTRLAPVFQHGGEKYGRLNWRKSGIKETTYWGAIDRHLEAWKGGEDQDPDSGESHLLHVIASCMILLDAEAHGSLERDRGVSEALDGHPSNCLCQKCSQKRRLG